MIITQSLWSLSVHSPLISPKFANASTPWIKPPLAFWLDFGTPLLSCRRGNARASQLKLQFDDLQGIRVSDLALGCRQFSHQSQRNRQFLQLKMRTQESDRVISPRFAGDLRYFDASVAKRKLGLEILAAMSSSRHVVRDPLIEKCLTLIP